MKNLPVPVEVKLTLRKLEMKIQILDYDLCALGYEAYNLVGNKNSKGH